MVKQYLDHCKLILTDEFSGYKPNRTIADTVSRFAHQNEYDLNKGFPLTTTKKTPFKAIVHELLWFLKGDTNIKYLVDNNVHIWDGNAFQEYLIRQGTTDKFQVYSKEWWQAREEFVNRIGVDKDFARINGDLGPVYGKQWRRWKTSDGKSIDQIAGVVEALKKTPQSRRMIISAWNPEDVPNMVLPPCHTMFHLNVQDGRLDCQLYQRSCDMFLGVPFNIASYAMLTQILAQQADLQLGRFAHSFGDAHFYCGTHERGKFYGENLDELKKRARNVRLGVDYLDILEWINKKAPAEREGMEGLDHVTGILEQLVRSEKSLPKLKIAKKSFDQLSIEDFELAGYDPHPTIKRTMAV